MGVFASTAPCSRCGGRGKIIKEPCKDCRGSGVVRRSRKIQASVPAGIDNGQTISIRGQGHAGKNGGPAGDLLVTITVRPHELFRREGTSVLCEAPITFPQAVLGRGDQYVTVYIETPRNLNREQKEALKKFAEAVGENNYEERKSFFRKFKK